MVLARVRLVCCDGASKTCTVKWEKFWYTSHDISRHQLNEHLEKWYSSAGQTICYASCVRPSSHYLDQSIWYYQKIPFVGLLAGSVQLPPANCVTGWVAISSHMGFSPTVAYCVKYATEVGGGGGAWEQGQPLVTKSESMRLTLLQDICNNQWP